MLWSTCQGKILYLPKCSIAMFQQLQQVIQVEGQVGAIFFFRWSGGAQLFAL